MSNYFLKSKEQHLGDDKRELCKNNNVLSKTYCNNFKKVKFDEIIFYNICLEITSIH